MDGERCVFLLLVSIVLEKLKNKDKWVCLCAFFMALLNFRWSKLVVCAFGDLFPFFLPHHISQWSHKIFWDSGVITDSVLKNIAEKCFWMGLIYDSTLRGCHSCDPTYCKLFRQVRTWLLVSNQCVLLLAYYFVQGNRGWGNCGFFDVFGNICSVNHTYLLMLPWLWGCMISYSACNYRFRNEVREVPCSKMYSKEIACSHIGTLITWILDDTWE